MSTDLIHDDQWYRRSMEAAVDGRIVLAFHMQKMTKEVFQA